MESVTLTVYYEPGTQPKKYGACYTRANGQQEIITTGERASGIAKDKASAAVKECDREPFTVRKDGVMDVGHGWIDELEPDSE